MLKRDEWWKSQESLRLWRTKYCWIYAKAEADDGLSTTFSQSGIRTDPRYIGTLDLSPTNISYLSIITIEWVHTFASPTIPPRTIPGICSNSETRLQNRDRSQRRHKHPRYLPIPLPQEHQHISLCYPPKNFHTLATWRHTGTHYRCRCLSLCWRFHKFACQGLSRRKCDSVPDRSRIGHWRYLCDCVI